MLDRLLAVTSMTLLVALTGVCHADEAPTNLDNSAISTGGKRFDRNLDNVGEKNSESDRRKPYVVGGRPRNRLVATADTQGQIQGQMLNGR